jgi:GNAT superfamily N-acetyltransferase
MEEVADMRSRPGLQAAAGRIARSFGIRFYDLYFGEGELRALPEPVDPSLAVTVCEATPEDLNRMICRTGGAIRAQVEHNLAIRSTCYVAEHEDTVVGYLWVNRETIDLVGMHVAALTQGSSFVHTVFVFPKQRRKGIFQFLFLTACQGLKEAGCASVACLVDKANRQSLEAFRQAGIRFRSAAVLKLPGIRPLFFCRAIPQS